jgi:hypothetical protein
MDKLSLAFLIAAAMMHGQPAQYPVSLPATYAGAKLGLTVIRAGERGGPADRYQLALPESEDRRKAVRHYAAALEKAGYENAQMRPSKAGMLLLYLKSKDGKMEGAVTETYDGLDVTIRPLVKKD